MVQGKSTHAVMGAWQLSRTLPQFVLCVSTSTEVKVRQNQDLARYRHFVPS